MYILFYKFHELWGRSAHAPLKSILWTPTSILKSLLEISACEVDSLIDSFQRTSTHFGYEDNIGGSWVYGALICNFWVDKEGCFRYLSLKSIVVFSIRND